MLKFRKTVAGLMVICIVSLIAPINAMAAHALTPAEEEIIDKASVVIEHNRSKFLDSENAGKLAAQYENEIYHALMMRNDALDDNAVAEISGLIDHINGEVEGLTTADEFINIAPNIVGEINSVIGKYGMFLSLDNYGYAHISSDYGATKPGKTKPDLEPIVSAISEFLKNETKGSEGAKNAETTKAENPLKVKGKTVKIKRSVLKKKSKRMKINKAVKFTEKGVGDNAYAKISGNKKISINKKTGTVKVKKGLKKGTYRVKIRVTAAGNQDYQEAVKETTVKIIVE